MVVELAAVRLLAPWFGTSQVVWTNVIAVILLALSIGYLLGGRLTERSAPLPTLSWALFVAGGWVAWLPWLGAALARWLMPEGIALHEAASLVGWGSLALASAVFLPPATLLGMVCPLVFEGLARARNLAAGRAGGAVLFASTAGSLAGVFGTSHLLLPVLGLQRTFWLAGALLFLAGGLARILARTRGRGLMVVLVVLGGGAALAAPARPKLRDGLVELARRESTYQALRVVEEQAQGTTLRYLQVNEGFDSFQSVWQPELGVLPVGFYYNDFLLPRSWSEASAPWRVLVLGLGAGTVTRVFSGEHERDTTFVGVELDPAVVEIGRQYFDLGREGAQLEIWSGVDARVALRIDARRFDQVVLDCYANQVEIPPHLCTVEFYRQVLARLEEGGWLTANLGGFGFDDPVVATVSRTCAEAFGAAVLLVRVPQSRNYMLIARKNASLPWEDGALAAPSHASTLALGPRRLPGFARLVDSSWPAEVLTDDRCPIEKLQLRSLAEARSRRRSGGGS